MTARPMTARPVAAHLAPQPLMGTALRAGFVRVARAGGDWLAVLLAWQDRATQRHRLSELNDHMLQDLGLSRAEADTEAGKPFWRL